MNAENKTSIKDRKTLLIAAMWERFTYYGIRSNLMLYMLYTLFATEDASRQVFGLEFLQGVSGTNDTKVLAGTLFGMFATFTTLFPIIGAFLSDRWLGRRNGVIVGSSIWALGTFALVSPGFFLFGLFLTALGQGFIRPNIIVQLGALHRPDDSRRDVTFLYLSLATFVGSFFSPMVFATIAEKIDRGIAFVVVGIFVLLGMFIYLKALSLQNENAALSEDQLDHAARIPAKQLLLKGLLFGFALEALWSMFDHNAAIQTLAEFVPESFEGISGMVIGAMPSALAVLLIPLVLLLGKRHTHETDEIRMPKKLKTGFIFFVVSIVLAIFALVLAKGNINPMLLVALGMFTIALSELCFAPMMYSYVTRIAHPAYAATTVAAIRLAGIVGAQIGSLVDLLGSKILTYSAVALFTMIAIYVLKRPDNSIRKSLS